MYFTPRLRSTDLVQLHVSVEDTEAQRGPGPCSKSARKSEANLRLLAWRLTQPGPELFLSHSTGIVAQAGAGVFEVTEVM